MKAKVFDRPQAKNKGMAWCCILLFIIWISISYMIIIFKDYPKWENTFNVNSHHRIRSVYGIHT